MSYPYDITSNQDLIIAYSAMSISVIGRFIFMYLLYTRQSTNIYSLVFSILNIVSSSLWITYGRLKIDTPLIVRGSTDLVLFTISTSYIVYNRIHYAQVRPEPT